MLGDFIHKRFDTDSKSKADAKTSPKGKKISNKESEGQPLSSAEKDDKKQSKYYPEDKPCAHDKHFTEQIKDKLQEFIGHHHHVPFFLKDNQYIHTGYRIHFTTPKKVLKSLFILHNESVNIWSHLGGAIILIIICFALCFSVSKLETHNLKKFVQVEVSELFEPIYERLPNIPELEAELSEKLSQTKGDITKLGESTIINLETKLESISSEIERVKKNINPEEIGKLLNKLKDQLDSFSDMVGDIKDSVTLSLNKEKLEKTSASLKEKLTELKTELIHQIDSLDLDWIDIYKYIHPSYHPVLMLKDGQRLMPLSKWPIIVFLLSAVFCLLCSATYHLFWCLEEKISQVFRRLDYAGISILITGSCFPPFVYGFYCQPFYANLYLSIIGFTSIVVFFVSLGDKIHEDKNKKIKSFMYGGLGVFAGFPLIHIGYLTLTISETNDNLDFSTSIPYYLSMGVCYLGGLSIYASKCPERFMPGKVDIWGHSHQIWHICVLLGIVLTYIGAFDNYYTRMQIPCIGCGL